jgi:hypothetical protein
MTMNQDGKKILKISLLSLLFLLMVVFVFFNSRDLVFGVKIKNVNLTDGMKVSESNIKVTGTAKNAVKLTLNDREISIDQKGNFEETLALFSGYNVVNLKAEDKFGNHDEKNYQVIK